jgi:hypothetical protein
MGSVVLDGFGQALDVVVILYAGQRVGKHGYATVVRK